MSYGETVPFSGKENGREGNPPLRSKKERFTTKAEEAKKAFLYVQHVFLFRHGVRSVM